MVSSRGREVSSDSDILVAKGEQMTRLVPSLLAGLSVASVNGVTGEPPRARDVRSGRLISPIFPIHRYTS
jgi:hypothetical protein